MSGRLYPCPKCGDYMWHDRPCATCLRLADGRPFDDDRRLRCPACREIVDVSKGDLWEIGIYEQGDHDVDCPACDATFTVRTEIKHEFTSPAFATPSPESEA